MDADAWGAGRSPYGERGLKCLHARGDRIVEGSLSLRRAWIEIPTLASTIPARNGRSPYGERGLKFAGSEQRFGHLVGCSPYGERGLKWLRLRPLPRRGARRSPYGERGLK